MPVSLPV
ncbi:hypothetical protein F383_16586 [Gossypium arboreum]|nr:hypothetical protein F383_16586 [Gossypium arboreum]